MSTGVVKYVCENRGFGFISPDDGFRDVFVRLMATGFKLEEGQKVRFEVVDGEKGPKAQNVVPIDDDMGGKVQTVPLMNMSDNKSEWEEEMQEYVKLLTANYNLILTGAPGTGKTYLAKQIARQMIGIVDGEKLEENGQFEFVQFHPSYDYTDFVEGLRPVNGEKEKEIGFELKDGIFKAFCEKAIRQPNAVFVFIIDEINRGEISKIFGELFFSIEPSYRGPNGTVKTQYSNMQKEPNEFDNELKSADGNYGHFYIPENIYIIGTMNDIDRSVESFDFAMRRRFTWKEIKANENTGMLSLLGDKEKDAKDRLISLNNAIWDDDKTTDKGIEGQNSSYHIGASYFLKLKNYKDDPDSFAKLWEYHLEPLLKEYLRGRPDAETRLTDLENAYNGQASTKANKPENQESVANVDASNNTNI
jgi:5-methylcytosine-specific restriction protein B